jgi:oligopeptide/dipeptide ABC transporter ATP-binding protein
MSEPLLDVRDLRVTFLTDGGDVTAVDGVSLALGADEVLGIVGESGSGKSVTMMSVMRLVPERNTRFEGEVLYGGRDLMQLSRRTMREVRGSEIAMIFQDPMTSLNAVYTVGWQIAEQVREHEGLSAAAARDRAIELLRSVGIPDAEQRVDDYPHQFSGGMRQRVMIAMALSCNPRVLIADEPTTALDVMVQAQILELLDALCRDFGLALVLVTHDLPVVAQLCDRCAVMYAGEIVERGPLETLYHTPGHPYTRMLFAASPDLGAQDEPVVSIPGAPPRLDRPIAGCPFRPRCDSAFAACAVSPVLQPVADGHDAACHLNTRVPA